ncbi:uncharacterized protein BDZ83DRAFT_47223 [Colletotrichum acutatum]|uniref:Uncharacterized protein n=1 Tax=Glomerella acutata TaxID=27357 RepID=A0AAD8XKV2_GLOAC|nr:uncharacterized protein BDZ83DRAFT_47223 [Colletotrichum acutatum]KAK1729222.1 hypothetical protein BDZ83DRAFT_47223 [Colletotrichum acutatum]
MSRLPTARYCTLLTKPLLSLHSRFHSSGSVVAPPPPAEVCVMFRTSFSFSGVDHHILSHSRLPVRPSVASRRREAHLFFFFRPLLHNLTGLPGFLPHLVVLVQLAIRSVPRFFFTHFQPPSYPLSVPRLSCAMGGERVFSEHRLLVRLNTLKHIRPHPFRATLNRIQSRVDRYCLSTPQCHHKGGQHEKERGNEKGEKNKTALFRIPPFVVSVCTEYSAQCSCLPLRPRNTKILYSLYHSPLRGNTTFTPDIASFPTLCVGE